MTVSDSSSAADAQFDPVHSDVAPSDSSSGEEVDASPPVLADRARLVASFEELLAVWNTVSPSAGSGVLEDDLEAATETDLLALVDALAAHQRQFDAVLTITAQEISTRCAPHLCDQRLAFRHGYRSSEHFLADRLDLEYRNARALTRVGRAIIGDRGLTGERLPPVSEHVAAALRDGALGVAHANDIVGLTRRLAPKPHVDPAELGHGEHELVVTAIAGMPLPDFRKVIARLEAHLDPDGVAPRLEGQRHNRGLSFRTDADTGMLYVRGKFDTESAAYITHALEGYTTGVLRRSRGFNQPDDPGHPSGATSSGGKDRALDPNRTSSPDGTAGQGTLPADVPVSSVQFRPTSESGLYQRDQVEHEQRTIPQIQADALVDFAKHIIGCDHSKLPGPSTTVVVRIDSRDIMPIPADPATATHGQEPASAKATASGFHRTTGQVTDRGLEPPPTTDNPHDSGLSPGHRRGNRSRLATIDGSTIIDAETARKLAAAAGTVAAVLGRDGVVLDLAREVRHFNRYQRLALIERDGGCAFCGLPPGMTEAHHIRWWHAHNGATDLDNGILLCTTCHHRVHTGWHIRIIHDPHTPAKQRARQSNRRGKNSGSAAEQLVAGSAPSARGGTVWFIPPASIDPRQEPRLGGRKRFDITYRNEHPPIPIPGHEHTSWTSHHTKLG